MNTEEKIKVMQAFVEGKTIERLRNGEWVGFDCEPSWDWYKYSYRIKPEPKIIYVNEDKGELMSCHCGYNSKDIASGISVRNGPNRMAVEYIELTDEVKEKLNIK